MAASEHQGGTTSSAGGSAEDVVMAEAQKRFEVKSWNAVALWSWDILVDNCAICRNNLMEPSIEYQANPQVQSADSAGLKIAFVTTQHF